MNQRSALMILVAAATGVAGALVGAGPGLADEQPADAVAVGNPMIGAVFAPDTDPEYAQDFLDALRSDPPRQQFQTHWNPASTALNNGGGARGDALELTWSILPDGTTMPAQDSGDTTCDSNLIATFDALYGAGAWQAEIQNVWDDWTGLVGNRYTPAVSLDANGTPIDDGAPWPFSPGVAGVRGDIRIGGCAIDGNSGTLAYNFYPNTGDMKIEATDSFYAVNGLGTAFHNVFSHEHGHGAGLAHVCPTNGTKLMEPFVNLGFTGLQHDDIRGVQRGYGDRFELIDDPNDSAGAATPLSPSPTQSETLLSLDGTDDTDWFSFTAGAGDRADITVAPNGFTYNEGPCGGSTGSIDSASIQDLAFEIRNSAGVLTTVDAGGPGATETISDFVFLSSGTYFVRVVGSGDDDAQLYDLTVTKNLADPMDFGDAPAPYPTLLADDGARHGDFGVVLGDLVDTSETDGIPTVDAQGDDNAGTDDEDGVTFTSDIEVGTVGEVDVFLNGISSVSALLNAWIDFNRDGDWNDLGEQVFDDEPIDSGLNSLTFNVPLGADPGSTYARFRISQTSGLSPTGAAPDGEVEDYRVTIVAPPSAPSAPTGVTVTPGDGQVDVSWTAPASDGGSPIASYTASASTGGGTCTTATTSCTVNGLTNGTTYTFGVTATNAIGTSPSSAPSAPVTPVTPDPDVVTVEPGRFLDTRTVNGFTIDDQFLAADKITGGTFTKIKIAGRGDIPTTAVGVHVNLTAIRNEGRGFATLYPCTPTPPTASTLNYTPGINIANATTIALDTNGDVCIFTSTTAHFALDITAYIPAGSDIVTVEPGRFLDTRTVNGFTIDDQFLAADKITGGTFTKIKIAGRGDIPTTAVGVHVNLTAIRNEGRGFATLYPCTPTPPTASTLNYTPGINIANATTIALDTNGDVCIFTSTTAHFALDITAYIPAGSDIVTVEPGRFLDTRTVNGFTIDDQFLAADKITGGTFTKIKIAGRGDIPTTAVGVHVNLTAIRNEGRGFATLYPCTPTPPTASTLNYTPGINIANATTIALDTNGDVCIFTSTTAHFALDITAYIAEI